MGRCAHKSAIFFKDSFKCVERIFTKISLMPNTAFHNNTSWYTDADGFLEHSPSWGSLYNKGPTLQKIILFWGDPPSYNFKDQQWYLSLLLFICSFIFKLFFIVVQVQLSSFPPTMRPCPSHPHFPPSILPTFAFVHVSFIHVP